MIFIFGNVWEKVVLFVYLFFFFFFNILKPVQNGPWHNLLKQELLPYLAAVGGLQGVDSTGMYEVLKFGSPLKFGSQTICIDEAYSGGGCLALKSPESAIFP